MRSRRCACVRSALCGTGHRTEHVLEFFNSCIDFGLRTIVLLILDFLDSGFELALGVGRNLIADFLQLLFCLIDNLFCLVLRIFFFAVCGGTLLWYLRRLLTGVWRREAVSWTVGTIGGTGILIQIFDRTPSVLRKDFGVVMGEQTRALFAAFEEGLELLLPLLIVLAVYQAAKADRAQEAAWPKA